MFFSTNMQQERWANSKEKDMMNKTLNVTLPGKILSKMRLNKNFANVYTPFHEMDDFDESTTERKERRQRKRDKR